MLETGHPGVSYAATCPNFDMPFALRIGSFSASFMDCKRVVRWLFSHGSPGLNRFQRTIG